MVAFSRGGEESAFSVSLEFARDYLELENLVCQAINVVAWRDTERRPLLGGMAIESLSCGAYSGERSMKPVARVFRAAMASVLVAAVAAVMYLALLSFTSTELGQAVLFVVVVTAVILSTFWLWYGVYSYLAMMGRRIVRMYWLLGRLIGEDVVGRGE